MSVADRGGTLLERLRAHHTLAQVPTAELEWLVSHGTLRRFAAGELVSRKGEPVPGLHVILEGRMSHHTDQSGVWRKAIEWRGGEITGQLPYSRMVVSPGNTIIDEPTETLFVAREDVEAMPVACPQVTAALVHVMLDRARAFKSNDLQLEKMASLGSLAAGLAHELNNPASAAARSARLVSETLTELDTAARALGAARLDAPEAALVERVRDRCFAAAATSVLSPLERSDREEAIARWLAGHDAEESFAAPLAETDVSLALLDDLARTLQGDKLRATLRWVAAGCTLRGLARDIERAASRVHALVSAVKGFTYMDHAKAPEPVDVAQGLTDTLALLAAKARSKAASVTVEVPADLPRVRGFGGELNQVWANLIDNALDAVPDGGRVVVTAQASGPRVVVRVTDDGPGIPPELKSRIFDPFVTTKPVGKGTGLGLDIVRRLVDRNEGMIEVESQPGRTEFRVALPAIA